MIRRVACALVCGLVLVVMGCGGKSPPPETPEKETGKDVEPPAEPEPAEPAIDPEKQALNEDLESAVSSGNWIAARLAMEQGADTAVIVGVAGMTDLHVAALVGDAARVKELLGAGADAAAAASGGATALHMAGLSGSKEVADLLVEAGADVKAEDGQGRTAVHYASLAGQSGLVQHLVTDKKAPVVVKGSESCSPLFDAVESGNLELVKFLVGKGAKASDTCTDGETPLHLAASRNLLEVATFLVSKGAKAAAKNDELQTPLHFVAADCPSDQSCLEMAKFLVKKGAKKNAKDEYEKTPYDYAIQGDDGEMIDFLKK